MEAPEPQFSTMLIPTEFAGKRVAVLGLARSGMAAAEVLKRLGAHVSLYDKKPTAELAGALETARQLGLTVAGDGTPIDLEGLDYLKTRHRLLPPSRPAFRFFPRLKPHIVLHALQSLP